MEMYGGHGGGGARRPLAVIDIGSNSGRIVVLQIHRDGAIEILADSRASLRLIRGLDARRRLKPGAIVRAIAAIHDFRALAEGSGARTTIAVATAAVREAENGRELLERIRSETGIRVEVLTGAREARCAFLGAVYGLPVRHGLLLDVGGGSVQLAHFRDRRLRRSWSLPLGALRMSDRFLRGDPPRPLSVRKLRANVMDQLARSRIPALAADEALVGTGGTIRNLAKVDARSRGYPIPRLHGYEMSRRRTGALSAMLASRRLSTRTALPGLNADRADSIVGGCQIVEAAMDLFGAGSLLVSGQGLREGIVLEALGRELPGVDAVRRASIDGLTARFRSWDAGRARRRAAVADHLLHALVPEASEQARELLMIGAVVLDVGRAIDYYRRHEHAAMILRSTDLMGFSHREIGFLSAMVEFADDGRASAKRYRPVLRPFDWGSVERAGVILALADEIEHRLPPGAPARVGCRIANGEVTVRSPGLSAWRWRAFADRFRKAFGADLHIGSREIAA